MPTEREAPFTPRHLPGGAEWLPQLPDRRCSPAEGLRVFLARQRWLQRHGPRAVRPFVAPRIAGGAADFTPSAALRYAAPLTAVPLTVGAWAQSTVTSAGTDQRIGFLGDGGSTSSYLARLTLLRNQGALRVEANGASGSFGANTGNSWVLDTWHSFAFDRSATNAATGVLDGDWANRATSATDTGAVAGVDRCSWGALDDGAGPRLGLDGPMAECFVLDVAWGQAEHEAFGKGIAAPLISPHALVAYVPAFRGTPWRDVRRALDATVVGTVGTAVHLPLIYPRGARALGVPSSAPSASGTAAISGGGALAAGVRKEARQPAAAAGGGDALALSGGAHAWPATLVGGGAALASTSGVHAGSSAIVGGGAPSATGVFIRLRDGHDRGRRRRLGEPPQGRARRAVARRWWRIDGEWAARGAARAAAGGWRQRPGGDERRTRRQRGAGRWRDARGGRRSAAEDRRRHARRRRSRRGDGRRCGTRRGGAERGERHAMTSVPPDSWGLPLLPGRRLGSGVTAGGLGSVSLDARGRLLLPEVRITR